MIPGFIITWLTFPGVIIHEFAHKFFCSLTGTKVLEAIGSVFWLDLIYGVAVVAFIPEWLYAHR